MATKTPARFRIEQLHRNAPDSTTSIALASLLQFDSPPWDDVHIFHHMMGLPIRYKPTELSVSDRLRRLLLTFEEFMETMHASGFEFVLNDGVEDIRLGDGWQLRIEHIEGSKQDLVEIADGIGDQLVTNIGHALEHGFPIWAVFKEIMLANCTKLDANGKPIVNQCKHFGGDKRYMPEFTIRGPVPNDISMCHSRERTNDCDDPNNFIDPTKPKGKILKPKEYVPPNIAAVLDEYTGSAVQLGSID